MQKKKSQFSVENKSPKVQYPKSVNFTVPVQNHLSSQQADRPAWVVSELLGNEAPKEGNETPKEGNEAPKEGNEKPKDPGNETLDSVP